MILHAPDIVLRPFAGGDLASMLTLWTEPLVRRHLFDDRVLTRAEAQGFLDASQDCFERHGYGLWVGGQVADAEPVVFAGLLGTAPEGPSLVVGVAPTLVRRGWATRASRLVLAQAFDHLQLPEVWADVDAPNVASLGLLDKLGFVHVRDGLAAGRPLRYYRLERARWCLVRAPTAAFRS